MPKNAMQEFRKKLADWSYKEKPLLAAVSSVGGLVDVLRQLTVFYTCAKYLF